MAERILIVEDEEKLARMVELAGGEYVLADMNAEKSGTQKMEMEQFYASAGKADVIIYVFSMGGRPQTLSDLLARGEIDTERMARVLLEEYRSCKIGRFTLEGPEDAAI